MAPPADAQRHIILFGGAAIHAGGSPIAGRAAHRHPLAILALLVASGGRAVTRDKLIALLWPERDSDGARHVLKVLLHELRKERGDAALRATGDQLSADPTAIACDVSAFLAAIERGDDAAAAAAYAGPFLDGFFLKDAAEFERWVDDERARLASLYGAALQRLAAAAEQSGDREALLRWRRAQAAHEPYRSDLAQHLIEAMAASGDPVGAVRFAESFAERRRDEIGIGDDEGVVALARRLTAASTPVGAAARPTDGAIAPVRAPEPFTTVSVRRRPNMRLAAVIGIGIVATLLAATFAANAVSGRGSASHEGVTVMPFSAFGADTTLRSAMLELLAARFDGDSVTRGVITGEITGARDSTIVSARLTQPTSAAPISARAAAPSGASMASVADRIAIELMARAAGQPEDRIAGLANRPMAAARSYLAAQLAYKSARYTDAERLFADALDADSTFGAAGLGLAMANSWTVISDHYGRGRDAALGHLAAMSGRDRAFAHAFFGPDPTTGPPQPAPVYLKAWEDLVERYPDWTEAWYQLGDRYYHYGRLSGLADADDHARTAFRRALASDSLFAAPLHHLVEIYAARGELADLRSAGARYFAANPGVNRDRSAIGWEMAAALGDSDWLRRIRANFDSMPREELTRIAWVTDVNEWPRGDAERAAAIVDRVSGTASEHEKALILKFTLSLNAGKPAGAHAAAAALGEQFPDRPVGALWDLYAAMFATGGGDSALARDAATRLAGFVGAPVSGDHVRRDQHHLAACMTGYWEATRGDVRAARTAFDRVTADLRREDNNFARRNGRVCLAVLSATIATQSRSPGAGRAVAALDTILLEERVPPHVILEAGTLVAARLHAALGDTAAALVAARRREHLTGDPVFLAAERRAEALYAAGAASRK